ncbi:MAG: hypothetical protein HUU49_03065 [Candidatus Buchananbacteria bacterium]|nr:hypothetical protein [Candidatus Buchananbacteria bacterium]
MAGMSKNNGHSNGACDQPIAVKVYDLQTKQVTGQSAAVVVAGKSCTHCFVAFASHPADVVQLGPNGDLAHLSCQKSKERRDEMKSKQTATA